MINKHLLAEKLFGQLSSDEQSTLLDELRADVINIRARRLATKDGAIKLMIAITGGAAVLALNGTLSLALNDKPIWVGLVPTIIFLASLFLCVVGMLLAMRIVKKIAISRMERFEQFKRDEINVEEAFYEADVSRYDITDLVLILAFMTFLLGCGSGLYGIAYHLVSLQTYVEASKDLVVGKIIASGDLAVVSKEYDGKGDPISRKDQAIGMVLTDNVKRGEPLFQEILSDPPIEPPLVTKDVGAISKLLDELKAINAQELNLDPQDAGKAANAVIDLLELQRGLATSGESGATIYDVVEFALDIGKGVLDKTNSRTEFLTTFANSFADKLGEKIGEGAGQAVNELGRLVYRQLTKKTVTAPSVPVLISDHITLHYETIGATKAKEHEVALKLFVGELKEVLPESDCLVRVYGHTDTLGSDTINYDISRQRAKAVAAYLSNQLSGLYVDSEGWGERRLAFQTDDGVASQDNRRVEIMLSCHNTQN